jgi:hypothetical protein
MYFLCVIVHGATVAQNVIPFGVSLSGSDAVPPSDFGASGCGRLWLSGTNLVYRFATVGFSQEPVELRGPAGRGTNGALLHVLPFSRSERSRDYCRTAEGLPPINPYPGFPGPPAAVMEGVVPMAPEEIEQLIAGSLYATYAVLAPARPDVTVEYATRGQITLLDSDGDGVPDFRDQCPNTPVGSLINSNGCGIEQLCPCEAPWRNHGEFVTGMQNVLREFFQEGLITSQEQRELLRTAAESSCGKGQR